MGFAPAYSLTEVFNNLEHVEFWEADRRGEEVDWQGFFVDYEAAVHWPACSFYEDLMETFSKAHVILTVRDAEPWYESMSVTIYQLPKGHQRPRPGKGGRRVGLYISPGYHRRRPAG